jgi:hypothetical protein
MAHHSTRNTISRAKYCKRCGRQTQHAVSDRTIAHCLECGKVPEIYEFVSNSVEIEVPCECDKYPFAHYHAEQSNMARQRRFEDAKRGRA